MFIKVIPRISLAHQKTVLYSECGKWDKLKGYVKNEISVIIYWYSIVTSKPEWVSVFCWTQKKIFYPMLVIRR